MAAAAVVVVATEVGRTGAAAAGLLLDADEEVAGQTVAPHARSVGQQPPPRLAGQDW